MLSVCGLVCDECRAFNTVCKGCLEEKGKPFWTKDAGKKFCDIYSCCYRKKLAHCGKCDEVPCELFRQFKDPLLTKEQFEQSVQDRADRLKEAE